MPLVVRRTCNDRLSILYALGAAQMKRPSTILNQTRTVGHVGDETGIEVARKL